MSHFSVWVVSKDGEDLGKLLQPFHEYECTGENDQYVQDVDITDEKLFSTQKDGQSLVDLLVEEYGFPVVNLGESVDRQGKHEWGWIEANEEGECKVFRRTNPNAKWDWWQVGGRYSNSLLLKTGEQVDSAQKKNINLEGMVENTLARAKKTYQAAHELIEGALDGFITWKELLEKRERGEIAIEEAREFYNNQPAVQALRGAGFEDEFISYFDHVEDFLISEEEFCQQRLGNSFTYALLNESGWHQKGDMGWWGCSSNEDEDWGVKIQALIAEVPEDSWITVVDCHI